jgi:hypothetical protein
MRYDDGAVSGSFFSNYNNGAGLAVESEYSCQENEQD